MAAVSLDTVRVVTRIGDFRIGKIRRILTFERSESTLFTFSPRSPAPRHLGLLIDSAQGSFFVWLANRRWPLK